MDQYDREALKYFGVFIFLMLCVAAPVTFCALGREDRYNSCLDVGGTADECSRLVNPSAWQKQHEREESARKQLEALRRK